MTVWSVLEECLGQLDEPFRRSEIVGWFRRHHPEVKESTLGAHIQAATDNATNRARNNALGSRPPLLRRIDHGLYVRARHQSAPFDPAEQRITVPAGDPASAAFPAPDPDLILVGCVRTKHDTASTASELFTSPLFAGRHRYAVASGLPWYILSAKFGLLAPDDVIGPYDVYLADQSPTYRKAWGEFVIVQLERLEATLRGRSIEVHAGAAYVDPIRSPLSARGAELVVPLAHLRQGEQVAWYGARVPTPELAPPPPILPPPEAAPDVQKLAGVLSEASRALSPEELISQGREKLLAPGMYSWWVDIQGAADLSRGLKQQIPPGLIYAGQAGATRWPSGKRSTNTLWGRIAGMHLVGAAEFSTFRRTLAAILLPVLGLDGENDPRLSEWIGTRLRIVVVAFPDADRLGETESAVLDELDPPLNLRGRPSTAIRMRLAELRRSRRESLS